MEDWITFFVLVIVTVLLCLPVMFFVWTLVFEDENATAEATHQKPSKIEMEPEATCKSGPIG